MSGKTEDQALEKWLSSQHGRYRQKCEASFNKFQAFLKEKYGLNLNGDTLLAQHVANRKSEDKKVKYFVDDLIPPFMAWLEEKNAHNSPVVQSGMVRGFFKYHRERLEVQSRIGFNETKKRYHAYTRDELCENGSDSGRRSKNAPSSC